VPNWHQRPATRPCRGMQAGKRKGSAEGYVEAVTAASTRHPPLQTARLTVVLQYWARVLIDYRTQHVAGGSLQLPVNSHQICSQALHMSKPWFVRLMKKTTSQPLVPLNAGTRCTHSTCANGKGRPLRSPSASWCVCVLCLK
jgi:hypothetical protein